LVSEINLQTLKNQSLADLPLMVTAGKHGCVLLSYGAVVLFGLELAEEGILDRTILPG